MYIFLETNFQDFSRTQIDFFEDSKIHINPFTPKTAVLIPLIVHYYFYFTVYIVQQISITFQDQ